MIQSPQTLNFSAEPVPLAMDEHGAIRVGGTRVLLETVVYAYEHGSTAEEIVRSYDSLALPDVHAVIAYCLRHRKEVGAYLGRREKEAEEIRRQDEARWDPNGVRERLLARRNQESRT